jgi:hypothetical protein
MGWLMLAMLRSPWRGHLFYTVQMAIAGTEVGMAMRITVARKAILTAARQRRPLRFGLGGAEYGIDLNKKHARAFRRQLAPFVGHARKAGRGPRRRSARTVAGRGRGGGIRAWVRDQGIAVSARGRTPASVAEHYEATTRAR